MTAILTAEQAAAAARVTAAQQAVHDAQAVFERTVRTEVDAGLTPSDVARALGIKNRQRVYSILGRGTDGADPAMPAAQPVVYLRGAGQSTSVWERIEAAMWARGWRTTRDRTTAWHLARAGMPVVLADFSWFDGLAVDWMTLGRVRARYEETAHEMDLPLASGGRTDRPMRSDGIFDEFALARLVAAALDETEGQR